MGNYIYQEQNNQLWFDFMGNKKPVICKKERQKDLF